MSPTLRRRRRPRRPTLNTEEICSRALLPSADLFGVVPAATELLTWKAAGPTASSPLSSYYGGRANVCSLPSLYGEDLRLE